MTESADTVAPKRTKALPVATEREQWQAKVDAAEAGARAAWAVTKAATRRERIALTLVPASLLVGALVGWLL